MQIEFVPANNPEVPAKYLAGLISGQLQSGRSVLWLLSGGSAISVAVAAAKLLAGRDLSKLTISLMDERFGEVDHKDSNWKQLLDAQFEAPGAKLEPVLTGASVQETAEAFESFLLHAFATTDYHLGLLGIGPDGHTSGILPHSPAVVAPGLVAAYMGGGYQRITTTPDAIKHLDEAVVYAAGQPKWEVLDRLETDLSVAEQPAQALKAVPHLTVFTDRPEK